MGKRLSIVIIDILQPTPFPSKDIDFWAFSDVSLTYVSELEIYLYPFYWPIVPVKTWRNSTKNQTKGDEWKAAGGALCRTGPADITENTHMTPPTYEVKLGKTHTARAHATHLWHMGQIPFCFGQFTSEVVGASLSQHLKGPFCTCNFHTLNFCWFKANILSYYYYITYLLVLTYTYITYNIFWLI